MNVTRAAARPPAPDREAGDRGGRPAVRALGPTEASAWDAFVAARADATFFHHRAWARAVAEGVGHETHALAAWREGRITGLLPLTHVRSRLFGSALISPGFGAYCGILSEDPTTTQTLAEAAADLGAVLRAERIELRHERAAALGPDWVMKTGLYATFKREISPSEDANLKAIPRKKRADLRKAIADKRLKVEVDVDIGVFHGIYARSVRDLGTPVFPRRLFAAIKWAFGNAVEISAVKGPEGPVAAVMTFWHKDQAMPYFGGALPSARALHAYDLLYWEVMRRAAARGCRIYDFGRSKKGTGSYDYKTYWGFTPSPLAYQHLPLRGVDIPDINPLNPKYRLMIAAWKRLPLPVANALGPIVARQIG